MACSEQLLAGIPNSSLEVFEKSGHFPFEEEPEAFWGCIGRFFRQGVTRDILVDNLYTCGEERQER